LVWLVKIKTSAKREIKKFDPPLQRQIIEALGDLAKTIDPRKNLIPYTGPLVGYWKLRLGQYRIIIEIQDEPQILEIIKAGHRSKVYR